MSDQIELVNKTGPLHNYLIGPEDSKQFLVDNNELLCLRASCQGCPHHENGCESEETELLVVETPHPRRGISYEQCEFSLLYFKEGHSFETLPKELWDSQYSDQSFVHRSHLHWVMVDMAEARKNKGRIHTLKGSVRWYGTPEDFEQSPYAEYFHIHSNRYVGTDMVDGTNNRRLVAMDFSAIEPRTTTLVCKEPQWIKIFQGSPKVIFRQIQLEPSAEHPYLYRHSSGLYCNLSGELDKDTFEEQCERCPDRGACKTVQDHYMNVAGDWHGVNAEGLYGTEFTHPETPALRTKLRKIAKIVGLALIYGGSAYTVARSMHCTEAEAQPRIDNFFSKLTKAKDYMDDQRYLVKTTGRVYNLFGRMRNVSKWAFSKVWKEKGYAERTGLNHPIQSSAAEMLKFSMLRADRHIKKNNLNPLYGIGLPVKIDYAVTNLSSLIAAMLSSVHDELVFGMLKQQLDNIIPALYKVMQIEDVIAAFGAGYSLEMDCEMDLTGSWTSTERFDTARVYLMLKLRKMEEQGFNPADFEPNFLLISDRSHLTKEILSRIQNSAIQDDNGTHGKLYRLGIKSGEKVFVYGLGQFSKEFVDSLGVPYSMAVYQ